MPKAPRSTRPSTPKLSEAASQLVYPSGIVTSGWPAVRQRGIELGLTFDPWQDGAHMLTLGRREDGKYAATVGGVAWSIPRQVGKTYSVGALMVLMCVMFPRYKVVWTAHHGRTITQSFRSIRSMCRRPKILPLVALDDRGKPAFRQSNGEQEILFRNGSIIKFGARAQGFGRGDDEVDAIIFDEAQILDDKALDDIVATAQQARHPHGALIFYTGTPPRPSDPSEAFTKKRDKALRGLTSDAVYIEMSADKDADLDDRSQWEKANPSFPTRTPLESMLRLRENLPSDDSWKREALGIWDEIGKTHVFGPGAWEACAVEGVKPENVTALAVAVSIERDHASIAAAGPCEVGVRVGAVDYREGTGWLVPEVKRIQAERDVPVVIAGTGPAADLIPALDAAGVRLTIARSNDAADAFAGIFDAVREGRLEHPDQLRLNTAVAGAHKRRRDDRWVWDRKNSETDISMLEAVTLALWGATNQTTAFNIW